MNVKELIEALEEYPLDLPVVINSCEIEDIIVRDEIYYSIDEGYKTGKIIKFD